MKSRFTKSVKQRFVKKVCTITFRHQAYFSENRQYLRNITSNYVTYNTASNAVTG